MTGTHDLGSVRLDEHGGTSARCECGKRFRSDFAPSYGGRRIVRREHARHVEQEEAK